LTIGCVTAAALAVAHAQQQPPTFGTTTRTVAVYATVTDPQGRLARDLTRDNFEVDDNGVKQELTVFSSDVQPITGIMLLDRSGSMKPNLELEVRAAETFIHGMLAEDRLRIGNFGKDIVIEPDDFTSDRDALFKVLHGDLQANGPTPLWNAIDRAIDKLLLEKSRRVVLALSDGVDEPLDFSGHAKSMKDEMKRAEENDIMIYAVGMEGLAPMQQQRATQGFGGIMPQRRNEPPMQKPDEGMAKIAAATGGGYFELTSPGDLLGKFDRVIDELHHQYALGFVPQKLDGKLHDLTVKVTRPGYTVRARKRYLAPRN
jgi:VWFA-related protein